MIRLMHPAHRPGAPVAPPRTLPKASLQAQFKAPFMPARAIMAALAGLLIVPIVLIFLSPGRAFAQISAAAAPAAVVVTEQVRAELVVHAPEGLQPGKKAWLGLKLIHKPGWHTYWRNPGDSGLPTTLEWKLPERWQAGDLRWPVPNKLPIGPLMNHGFEGTLLLASPLQIEPGASATAQADIALRADWLVCKDVCIPEGGDFRLKVATDQAHTAHAALMQSTQARWPQEWPSVQGRANVGPQGLSLELTGLPSAWQGRTLTAFPETPQVLDNAAAPQAQWQGSSWQALLAPSRERSESPVDMHFVIAPQGARAGESRESQQQDPVGVRVALKIAGVWPGAAEASASGSSTAPPEPTLVNSQPEADQGLALTLLLALLGGALLNLMPCVFPVLSLKVFGFAAHGADRRALALGGLAYTVGVVLSFAALAAVFLALRASGEQLGWGFQLQSPAIVAALAVLFTLMGLNLLGVFEFSTLLPGNWAQAQAQHPVVDQALTGVLAVVVASPCTAPFMGASLGVAVSLPAPQAMLVFVALGMGMALPYLVLSLIPGLAKRLPRPGVWMLHFKRLMAVPMMATVVWLAWVLGHQADPAGVDAMAALLGLLLALSVAAACWGQAQGIPGGSARGAVMLRAAALVVLAAGLWWTWPTVTGTGTGTATPAAATANPSPSERPKADGQWYAWSAANVRELNEQGQAVLVDYTAAWCVTCQVNKRSTLSDARVLQAVKDRAVVLMRADWTRRDENIGAELKRLGRSGVPVYAVYRGGLASGSAASVELLPELLTPDLVIKAVSR